VKEAVLQNRIKKSLTDNNCIVYKFVSPAQRGVPDLVVLTHNGVVFFLEVKQPGLKATVHQQFHLDRINDQKVFATTVTSVEEALQALEDANMLANPAPLWRRDAL
jgi:hypothetical protein